jgi:hypothetical protein
MSTWTDAAIFGVYLLFVAVIIPLVKVGFTWLKSKTQNEALLAALAEAEKVADQVVAGLQANVVEGLKAKSADGKLSPDEIKEVSKQAFDAFVSDISSKSLEVLADKADDIEAYIKNLIESRLAALKAA